ncbi:hypothetical protein SteCoe_18486 [Stentor coeruleus]|uniref:Uncharacterized protein n=1 Tax=Stentor coeruleus TaxID=5963 RepID=A0A1R2BWC6_9CILI|nr:hypothetical protein SteCoe_18486 [Stentor coeruleus]
MHCSIYGCAEVALFSCVCSANIFFCAGHVVNHHNICLGQISLIEKKIEFKSQLNDAQKLVKSLLTRLESIYSIFLNIFQESMKKSISLICDIKKKIREAKKSEDYYTINYIKEKIAWTESYINYKTEQFNSFIGILLENENFDKNSKKIKTQNLRRSQEKLDEIYLKYDIDLRSYSHLKKIMVTNDQAYIFVCTTNIGIC